MYEETETRRASLRYLFFEASTGGRSNLGDQAGTDPRSKKKRPQTRVIKKGQFSVVGTTAELLDLLFATSVV